MSRFRIPQYIDFPFGYLIEVRQLRRAAFIEENGADVFATWESGKNGGTVYLDKSRPVEKRRADLAHELIHAALDFQAKIIGGKHGDAKD